MDSSAHKYYHRQRWYVQIYQTEIQNICSPTRCGSLIIKEEKYFKAGTNTSGHCSMTKEDIPQKYWRTKHWNLKWNQHWKSDEDRISKTKWNCYRDAGRFRWFFIDKIAEMNYIYENGFIQDERNRCISRTLPKKPEINECKLHRCLANRV